MKIYVKAKPGAKEERVERTGGDLFSKRTDDHFIVAVKEAPVENRANKAIEKAIARYFKVPISYVKMIAGHSSRNKVLEIMD